MFAFISREDDKKGLRFYYKAFHGGSTGCDAFGSCFSMQDIDISLKANYAYLQSKNACSQGREKDKYSKIKVFSP